MPYVYSTMTNATRFVKWSETTGSELPQILRSVTIRGGAGLPAAKTLITAYGVGTEVTDNELEFLQGNESFRQQLAAGFLKCLAIKHRDPDQVVHDMAQRDGSAQMVPADYTPNKAPVTNAPTVEFTTRQRSRIGNSGQSSFR